MNARPNMLSSTTIKGADVVDPRGESLGKVEDVMYDLDTATIGYAVVACDGSFDRGGKLFAVPWRALRVDTDGECFVLDASRAMLARAPGFAKHLWPAFADRAWSAAGCCVGVPGGRAGGAPD